LLRLLKIQELLEAEVLTNTIDLDMTISAVKASDLMSDVLTDCESGSLLLTGLTNAQSVRTAIVVDVATIVFVRGKRPPVETVKLAEESKIPLLLTKLSMFDACGVLYSQNTIKRKAE